MTCAERETLEESGLMVTVDRMVGIYYRPAKGRLTFLFEATPRAGALSTVPNREIETRAYFLPSQLPPAMSPSARLRVLDATLRQERAFIRVLSG
jgi:ADP-ribose pyrophosphatase YjhB (NUDIX family)